MGTSRATLMERGQQPPTCVLRSVYLSHQIGETKLVFAPKLTHLYHKTKIVNLTMVNLSLSLPKQNLGTS